MVYKDGEVECTIHINHAKPAKFTAPDLPEPVPSTEAPRPPLGYLPAGLTCRPAKPRAPPADSSVAPVPPAAPAKMLCHRPPPLQPISNYSLFLLAGDLPGSIPYKVTLTP